MSSEVRTDGNKVGLRRVIRPVHTCCHFTFYLLVLHLLLQLQFPCLYLPGRRPLSQHLVRTKPEQQSLLTRLPFAAIAPPAVTIRW